MIKSRHITISLHVLIWGAVLVLPFFFKGPDELYAEIGPLKCNFFTLSNVFHIGLFYFNAFYLYPRFLTRQRWGYYMIWIVALIAVTYHLKLLILTTWFHELARDEAAFAFTLFPIIFFLVVSTIYRLVVDKINTERELSKRQAEHLGNELKFLRSQVSPHFLFNVLNNLVSMARHKSDLLEPALIRLSELMRYMLYESDEKKVALSTEIEYLKSYVELQKLRFEEDIDIITDIQHTENSLRIEPMLLIPFVENAFKHGVAPVDKPFIRIALKVNGNTLHFVVENRYTDQAQSKDQASGIGLSNVKARLNLLYENTHQLSINESNNIFQIVLSLQLK